MPNKTVLQLRKHMLLGGSSQFKWTWQAIYRILQKDVSILLSLSLRIKLTQASVFHLNQLCPTRGPV